MPDVQWMGKGEEMKPNWGEWIRSELTGHKVRWSATGYRAKCAYDHWVEEDYLRAQVIPHPGEQLIGAERDPDKDHSPDPRQYLCERHTEEQEGVKFFGYRRNG